MSPPDLIAVLFALALVFWLTSIPRPADRRVPALCNQRPRHRTAEELKVLLARDAPGADSSG